MSRGLEQLDRYSAASERVADQIIRAYSTSFGAATRLLGKRHRRHVRTIYALVRVADELVDGVAAEAGLAHAEQVRRLDEMERELESAMHTGYSSNPIIHAFANTARAAAIDVTLTRPFFQSMRVDLTAVTQRDDQAPHAPVVQCFDDEAHSAYVYGSAEVVGLMCLRVFLRNEQVSVTDLAALERGARSLGAAFQNVNFLRDLSDDTERLGRSYLSDGEPLTEAMKGRWVATIREQLADAEAVLPLLPRDARTAVDCARRLFSQLTDRLDRTPADRLLTHRVRVPNPAKAFLVLQSVAAARMRGTA